MEKLSRKKLIWGIGCFLAFQLPCHAQQSQSETDQSRQLLRQQMEAKILEAEAVAGAGENEDLGEQILVRRKPKSWNLSLGADVTGMLTTNAALARRAIQTDFALVHNDTFNFSDKITDEFTATASYRFSRYRYKRVISQDFDSHNAGVNFNYALPEDVNVYTGYQGTELASRPLNGKTIYSELDWTLGASKVYPLDFFPWMKERFAWFTGLQADDRIASPNDFDRFEVSPYTGFSFLITDQWMLKTFYRWQYSHYQKAGRKDFNNSVNANLSWYPFPWMSLSAFCGYTDNNSIGSSNDYTVFNTGATLAFSWTF